MSHQALLKFALAVFGTAFLLIYPAGDRLAVRLGLATLPFKTRSIS
jgi:hypothetical protein